MNLSVLTRKVCCGYYGDHELTWLEKCLVIMKSRLQLCSLLIEKMYHMLRQPKCSEKGAMFLTAMAVPFGNIIMHQGELIAMAFCYWAQHFWYVLQAAMATFSGREMQEKLVF